jgi:hypothetical protein
LFLKKYISILFLLGIQIRSMSASDPGFIAALEEAKAGASEGGVPIGACLVDKNGKILGRGHNMRVQQSSAILHVNYTFHLLLTLSYTPPSQPNLLTHARARHQP